jgi:hypothetical protein
VKRLVSGFAASALSSLVLVNVLQAQVLITGENGGKGSRAVMVSANAIHPTGFGTLTNLWVQYGYGVSNRVDAFVSYGNITVFGRSQSYVAMSSNVGLLRRSRTKVDVALFNTANFPINHREQACRVLLGSALIASRPVKVGGRTLTPYGGVIRLTPIGRALDPVFTPPSAVYNGIVGVAVPLGKVTFFFEYNPGGIQRSGGMGVLYVFPQRALPDEKKTPGVPSVDESSVERNSQ